MKWTIVALYKFLDLPAVEDLRDPLLDFCRERKLCGSLLLAREGVNGTVAGSAGAMRELLDHLENGLGFGPIDHKISEADFKPFRRLKVRLKKEIVHLGRPDLAPHTSPVGRYVEPKDWNALISNPDVRVVDTRNAFECEIGTFERAENPQTESFADFPDFVRSHLDPEKDKKVAMFCTGGIRCEKATAYLLEQGFEEVYHLKGGILNYFEEIPDEDSLWRGECFVFDDRVTVGQDLAPGHTECCRGCWNPLRPGDTDHPDYEDGVCCPRCVREKTEKQLAGARERERQRRLAARRAKEN